MRKWSRVAIAAIIALSSSAEGKPLYFDLTGTDTASFSLDSSQTFVPGHLGGNPPLNYDLFPGIPIIFGGSPTTAEVSFYDAASGGGFQITLANSYISPLGPVVFQGTLANPLFEPGSFSFSQDFSRGAINDRLVITDSPASAVPEPTTWALMLIGFAATALALRRRRGQRVSLGWNEQKSREQQPAS